MSSTDTYADLVRRVEDLENARKPTLRSGRGNVWGDNFGLADALDMPRCYVAQAGTQSMANGADVVQFATISRDTDGMFSTILPTRVTIRTQGIYDVKMNVHFTAGGGGNHRQAWVRKNGGTGRFAWDQRPVNAVLGVVIGSDSITMNAGDYLEIVTEHDNGGALALAPVAGENNGAELNVTFLSTI